MSKANSMANNGSTKDRNMIIIVIIATVALVAYFISLGNHYFAPPASHYAESLAAAHVSTPSWLSADAKSCGGDFTKLNPTEQQKLLTMFKGNQHDASNAIAMAYAANQ